MKEMTTIPEFCELIVRTELHSDMLKTLQEVSPTTLNKPQSSAKEVVHAHISTLHNVVKNSEAARKALRRSGAVDIVQKFKVISPISAILIFYLFEKKLWFVVFMSQSSFKCIKTKLAYVKAWCNRCVLFWRFELRKEQ